MTPRDFGHELDRDVYPELRSLRTDLTEAQMWIERAKGFLLALSFVASLPLLSIVWKVLANQ